MEKNAYQKASVFIFLSLAFMASFASMASANTLYSGETQTINLANEFDNITSIRAIGNSTAFFLNQTNETTLQMTLPEDYPADSFKIIIGGFKGEEILTKTVGGGSSGWRTFPSSQKNKTALNNATKQENNFVGEEPKSTSSGKPSFMYSKTARNALIIASSLVFAFIIYCVFLHLRQIKLMRQLKEDDEKDLNTSENNN